MHNGVLRNIIADLAHFRTCLQFELSKYHTNEPTVVICQLSEFVSITPFFFFLICISNKIILAIH